MSRLDSRVLEGAFLRLLPRIGTQRATDRSVPRRLIPVSLEKACGVIDGLGHEALKTAITLAANTVARSPDAIIATHGSRLMEKGTVGA